MSMSHLEWIFVPMKDFLERKVITLSFSGRVGGCSFVIQGLPGCLCLFRPCSWTFAKNIPGLYLQVKASVVIFSNQNFLLIKCAFIYCSKNSIESIAKYIIYSTLCEVHKETWNSCWGHTVLSPTVTHAVPWPFLPANPGHMCRSVIAGVLPWRYHICILLCFFFFWLWFSIFILLTSLLTVLW